MPKALRVLRPHGRTSPRRRMAALASLACAALLSLGQDAPQPAATAAVPSHRQADNVAVITIDEPITRVTAFSFTRRLGMAEQGGADAFVVELNTPGGEVGAVIDICDAIRSSSIANSVAWVHSTAYSGGAIIAVACKEIVTSSPGRMGDALPIMIGPTGLQPLPDAERQKQTAPIIAELVGSARLRGWDEYVVQGFAALGVELWWVRDLETGEELAINEQEYRLLFEREPPRTRPILAAAPNAPAPAEQPAEVPGTEEPPSEQPAPADLPEPADQPAPDAEGGTDTYRPASPALSGLEVAPEAIGQRSKRRTFSAEDKGRYELVGYLTSGDGPIVLNADDMANLGFASNLGPAGALAPIQNDADLAAFFGAKNVRRLVPTWSEALVRIMSHNIARGVLIVVFLIALFLEMSHPGVGLPAAVAAAALVGLLAPPALIGMANWWEIGAIGVGILLIILEIFVLPGFGVPGIAGLLLLFGGLLGTFVGDAPGGLFPDSTGARSDLVYGLVTIFLSTATAGLGMYFLAKHFGSIPLIGGLVLTSVSGDPAEGDDLLAGIPIRDANLPAIGATGHTLSPLRPSGRAQVGDRVLDVVSDLGYIEPGRPVRVVAADTFRIVVEEIGESAGDSQGGAAEG